MRYLAALAVIIVLAFSSFAMAMDAPHTGSQGAQKAPVPVTCTVQKFRPFSARVWNKDNWERGMPKKAVLETYRKRLGCAPLGHRKAIKKTWLENKVAYFDHRGEELFRVRITPYYCPETGEWWATECTIPLHESGYGSGGGNLYGMLDAWALHGCTVWGSTAWDASKRHQDICAHRHWATYGRGGWPSY